LAIGAVSPGNGVVRANGAVTVDIAEARAMYEATIAMHRRLIEAAGQGDDATFDRIGPQDLVNKADDAAMERLVAIVNTAPAGPADCIRLASHYEMMVGLVSRVWLFRREPELFQDHPHARQAFANPEAMIVQFDEGLDRSLAACENALDLPASHRGLTRALMTSLPQ
jgi:hypothetical protein